MASNYIWNNVGLGLARLKSLLRHAVLNVLSSNTASHTRRLESLESDFFCLISYGYSPFLVMLAVKWIGIGNTIPWSVSRKAKLSLRTPIMTCWGSGSTTPPIHPLRTRWRSASCPVRCTSSGNHCTGPWVRYTDHMDDGEETKLSGPCQEQKSEFIPT